MPIHPMRESAMPLAIYVHWPFCKAKCPYCDFNSHVREQVDDAAWRAALVAEIAYWAQQHPQGRVGSIFFGGGTPSLMPPETVAAVIDAVQRHWPLANTIEITLEANPTSVEAARFVGYRAAGVNRVSLGVQALNQSDLVALGRQHTVESAREALALAYATFDRVSFDLIYTRQYQTMGAWVAELEEALGIARDHVSLYQLTIEPGTQFFHQHARGALVLPEEDASTQMYLHTLQRMEEVGLPAYEISNFAREGQESRHNLAYWRGDAYLGIGPGAHGRPQLGGVRHASVNLRSPEHWLAAVQVHGHGLDGAPEALSMEAAIEERVLMGLRLREGIDAVRFTAQTEREVRTVLDDAWLQRLSDAGLVVMDDAGLRATQRGWPLVNSITTKLLGG
jgi:putative oxygen-independent coproporphyrinogen III oxidase